jgi:hypothetical protein
VDRLTEILNHRLAFHPGHDAGLNNPVCHRDFRLHFWQDYAKFSAFISTSFICSVGLPARSFFFVLAHRAPPFFKTSATNSASGIWKRSAANDEGTRHFFFLASTGTPGHASTRPLMFMCATFIPVTRDISEPDRYVFVVILNNILRLFKRLLRETALAFICKYRRPLLGA